MFDLALTFGLLDVIVVYEMTIDPSRLLQLRSDSTEPTLVTQVAVRCVFYNFN